MPRSKFNGKLDVEWISIDDRLPLDEFEDMKYGMIADVFILVVNPSDFNDDPAIVQVQFKRDRDQSAGHWYFMTGEPYPNVHIKNIRYWCYPPNYDTRQILEFERIKPLVDFCDGKEPKKA